MNNFIKALVISGSIVVLANMAGAYAADGDSSCPLQSLDQAPSPFLAKKIDAQVAAEAEREGNGVKAATDNANSPSTAKPSSNP